MSKIDKSSFIKRIWLNKVLGNVFVKNIALLMFGTAGAQLLGLLLMPVITRLFDSSQFGIAATFQSILVILCIVSNLRYELAIPLAKTEEDAKSLFVFNIVLLVMFSLIIAFLIALVGETVASRFNLTELLPFLWIFPFAILFLGLYQIFTYWGIRYKLYKTLAKTKISQVLSMLLIQIAGYKLGTISLIVGQSVGQGIGGFQLAKHAVSTLNRASFSWSRFKQLAASFKKFPLFDAPAALLNSLSTHLPILFLMSVFSPAITGAYALSNRVLSLPASLIAQAVSGAFYGEARELAASGKITEMVVKLSRQLSVLAIIPSLLIVFFAPALFALVFGSEWRLAGELASYSIVWIFLQFIYSPLSTSFLALNKQNYNLLSQITLFVLRIFALAIGLKYFNAIETIFAFSLASAIGYAFGLMLLVKVTNNNYYKTLLIPYVCTAILIIGAILVFLRA